jgi:hypothetical protein
MFMILEGAMISIATICLTVLHPAVCFQGAWHEANFNLRSSKGKYSQSTFETVDSESGFMPMELGNVAAARK